MGILFLPCDLGLLGLKFDICSLNWWQLEAGLSKKLYDLIPFYSTV